MRFTDVVVFQFLDLLWPCLFPSIVMLTVSPLRFWHEGLDFIACLPHALPLRGLCRHTLLVSRAFGINVDELTYVRDSLAIFHSMVSTLAFGSSTLVLLDDFSGEDADSDSTGEDIL